MAALGQDGSSVQNNGGHPGGEDPLVLRDFSHRLERLERELKDLRSQLVTILGDGLRAQPNLG